VRASIRDIVVAIAFGTIVNRLFRASADAGETSPYRYPEQTQISPLERLRRLRILVSA
jgi:hypothetical protein